MAPKKRDSLLSVASPGGLKALRGHRETPVLHTKVGPPSWSQAGPQQQKVSPAVT